jgi:diacylglycerol kinase family enzyme
VLNPAFGASFVDSPIAQARETTIFLFVFSLTQSEQPPTDGAVSADGRRWRRVHGPFMSVNLAVFSLRNGKSPLGLCPPSHLSSGQGDVVLVDRCGRFSFLRFLLGVAGAGTHMQLPHVQHHPCGEFIFVPDKCVCSLTVQHNWLTREIFRSIRRPLSSWNIDGEHVSGQSVHFKVRPFFSSFFFIFSVSQHMSRWFRRRCW